MRSLSVKLTLAFLVVGIAGIVMVAALIQLRTRTEFDRFVRDQNQGALASLLVRYYQAYGNWDGIEQELRIFQPPQPQLEAVQGRRTASYLARFILVDQNGQIVIGVNKADAGKQLHPSEFKRGIQIGSGEQVYGWLLPNPSLAGWEPDTPEGAFLSGINRATLYSAIGASSLALVLGGVLAYTLTRSLRELTQATQRLSQGELGYQVQVRSQDELGELAQAFNRMSLDLKKANDQRKQMTADIAHDLRTPLSVILGYTEALQDGKLPGTPEVHTTLHDEAQLLSHLIDDLRTLSLADAGQLKLNLQRNSAGELIQRAVNGHMVKAQAKGVKLLCTETSEVEVLVDPDRMAQVFDNLLENAIHYTPAGGKIELSASAGPQSVTFSLRDTGAGIPEEELPMVFSRFYRGDVSRQHDGSSGLGLAIAKSIVEAHMGKIEVESTSGQGSTFRITLPQSG